MKKHFDTRAVLSVTTGRLLTERKSPNDNGIDGVYELLGWMTDDQPFTHQLPRFARECAPWILRWHPELATAEDEIAARCDKGEVESVVKEMVLRFGETIELQKIPRDDHDTKNPIEELFEITGSDQKF